MGKFNNTDGVNFTRSVDDVLLDYARFLLEKKILSDEEFYYYIKEGKNELLELFMEKLYETETVKGVEVSTLDSFFHYCTFVLKEYNGQTIWNNFVRDMFMSIEQNKNTCVMASRQVGKSFFLYVLYPSFKMFLHRGTKFLHVSNIPQQCIENLRILKDIIDTYEFLYQKKEVYKGKELKWTERQIEYNGGMLITLSAGTSPKGLSVHYVIVDDILTEGAQLNDEEMENYIFGQLYPTVQRAKGRLIVSGTPLHLKDIYHLLMGDKPNFEGNAIPDGGISHKGFFSRMFPIMDDKENPLLPQIYSRADIEKIREIQGEIKFQREYMLNCIDESLTIFSEHLITSISDGEQKYYYSPDNNNQQFIIGVDVATSGEASADFSAFIVMELIHRDTGVNKVVRHIVYEKGMPISEQVNVIVELCHRFNNALVIVEKNNVGVAIIQELMKHNVNIEEYITTKDKKEGMIRYLVNEMKNKNLWFPEETNEVSRLKKELLNFGVKRSRAGKERMEALTGHDDLVMALAMANQASQEYGGLPFAILQ
jgi:phage terminase large subunit-like protein